MEKAAQGGRGFQTYGVDLGVLGSRNNVDDEIRSSASGGAGGGSRSSSSSTFETQRTSGGSQSGSSSGGHGYTYSSHGGSSHGGSSQQHSGENNDDDYEEAEDDLNYDDHTQSGQAAGGQGSSYRSSSSYSYSAKKPLNAHHESIDQQFKHYPHKRDVSSQTQTYNIHDACKTTQCETIRCIVGPIDKSTGALIALRTRLVAHTLHKVRTCELCWVNFLNFCLFIQLGGESEVKLSSVVDGRIIKLPYIGLVEEANEQHITHEVFVTAIPKVVPKPDVIPLWIVVLAACAGALILLLLIYLLYKVRD